MGGMLVEKELEIVALSGSGVSLDFGKWVLLSGDLDIV